MDITAVVDEIWKVLLPAGQKMIKKHFRTRRELIFPAYNVGGAGFNQLEDELLHRVKSEFGDQIGLSTEAYGAGCKLVLRKRKR